MYSCPTDDIHSVYVDNELPQEYMADYEAHLQSCESCSAKVQRFRSIKQAFKADSSKIVLTKDFTDRSFERLQTKLRYKKTISGAEKPTSAFTAQSARWLFAAAAAVIVAAILPVSISNAVKSGASASEVATIAPVTRTQNYPIANQNMVVSGNLHNNLAQTVGIRNFPDSSMADIDVLRPEFDEANKIHIKITVPGFDDSRQEEIDIKLPVNSYSGQLK